MAMVCWVVFWVALAQKKGGVRCTAPPVVERETDSARMILTDLGSTSEVGFRLFLGAKRKTEGFTR